jgi:hypothetical protein
MGWKEAFLAQARSDQAILDRLNHPLVEKLAPALAGMTKPNPEYPWRDPSTGDIVVPAQYEFAEFDPKDPKMQKIAALIRALLRLDI